MPKVCPICSTTYPDANAFCPVDGTTLRAAEVDAGLIGCVVADRYLVTDLLGEGGMGKVYLARHVRLPQQAAIKVLRSELVRDPSSVARFNREASNASQVEDQHVARVYDFGETTDGLVYLAMEYVPGKTLREIIETEGPLSPRRTAGLIRQIGAGLDAAHNLPKPLIHRDLKPDNVLVVTTPSGRDRVKVVDFGIAKAVGTDDRGLTKTGVVVGTPEFMSPEQLLGEQLDQRSDIYALALVAFQCLTGTLPFEMTTPERGLLARLTEAPRHLLDRTPGVEWPASLQAVFDAGLARDRERRPESAGTFAEWFVAAIDETWPDTASSSFRASRPTPSGDVPVAATSAAVPVPVPVLPAPAVAAPVRKRSWSLALAAGVVVVLGTGAVLARGRKADPAAVAVASVAAPSPAPVDSASPARGAGSSASSARRRAGTVAGTGGAPDGPGALPDGERPPASAPPGEAAQSLDTLIAALEEGQVDAARARTLAGSIRDLVPRLGRDDKTRARIGLVRASVLSGDMTGACEALQAAAAGASRSDHRAEIGRLDDQLGCG